MAVGWGWGWGWGWREEVLAAGRRTGMGEDGMVRK
jgi:hypothetical protein